MAEANMTTQMNWDLSSYFPEFNGPEMRDFKDRLKKDIKSLKQKAGSLSPLDDPNKAEWEEVLLVNENLLKRFSHLSSYIGCLSACDANNEAYLKQEADLAVMGAEFSKLKIEILRSIKDAPDELFYSFIDRDNLKDAFHYLKRLRDESHMRMAPDKEMLAADLGVDGISAWGRLYDTVTGKLEFEMKYPDGVIKRLPISQRCSLMEHPDRRIRKAAFYRGNEAWKGVEDVLAAALNAISGTRLTLNRYRGIDHFLDVALFQSSITRKALDAMIEAIFSELEIPRQILRLKAETMNTEGIAWYDLGAPLEIPDMDSISWVRGKSLVQDSFAKTYPKIGEFVQMVFDSNWVEWEPRSGKRPGGFCTGSLLNNESRIFMTFNDSIGDVMTLAHEAGHAFHSHVMRDLRPYARNYPMTLAESASTFGEMILTNALLEDPSISQELKALMLDMEINHGAIYLMDIPVRYEFEKSLYEERLNGELSVTDLKSLMVETQRRIFDEILEAGGEDPYFWASKLHFYITGITFYNFPYTFGYLLSRGLYSTFRKEGREFLPRYQQFLRTTGSDSAVNVARHGLGCDLEKPDFWVEAIHTLKAPYERFKKLLPRLAISHQTS
ncbi:MAG: M3 family oligoendopeptidase [Thermodesulfobacteriota bacterium]